MFLQLKAFFRSKYVKLYIVIFVTFFVTLTLLYDFYKYHSEMRLNIYQLNTYFIVNSNDDIIDTLKQNDNIINIEKTILFSDGENGFRDQFGFDWINLLDFGNAFLVGKKINKKEGLKSGEAILKISKQNLEVFPEIYQIRGKKISLKVANKTYNFEVKDIEGSNFSSILISNDDYNNIIDSSQSFSYIFDLKNYDEIDTIYNNLLNIDNIKDINYIENYDSEKTFNTLEELKPTIELLKYACIICSVIIFILLIIFNKEMIKKEVNFMGLERKLGYNKRQVKKYVVIKVLSLYLIVTIISLFIYFLIGNLILYFFPITVNFLTILKIEIIIFVFIFILLMTVNKNENPSK